MMRANGFTLIELLVAMTAGALLLGSMSWAIARLNQDVLQMKRGTSARHLLAVNDRLTSLLSGVRAGPNDLVELSDRRLSFVTNPPLSAGAIGLVSGELSVTGRSGDERLDLLLRDREGQPIGGGQPSILLAGQRKIQFAWVGEEEANAKLVAVQLVDQNGEAHELLVALPITGDANCQFDPISMACR
jgi:prepilin-type N-terminal cleavage/methylation domain-containing protein